MTADPGSFLFALMTSFDFILVLLSFVFALAIGQVLTSAGRLLVARRRVRFSGLLALAMLNALVTALVSWLTTWSFRDTKGINLYDVMAFFVMSVLIYLNCMAASPEPEEGEIDMEAFFWAQRRFYYGSYSLLVLVFVAGSVILLRTSQPQLFVDQAVSNIPFLAVGVVAFFTRGRAVQWVMGFALLGLSISWGIIFNNTF